MKLFISRVFCLLVALSASVFCWPAYANTKSAEDALVKQFYPQQWNQGTVSPGSYVYVNADLDGSGKSNYIVAVYTDGISGAVRVLKKVGNTADLVAAPSFPLMSGVIPSVSLIDIDGDGIPEVAVSFNSPDGRNMPEWILKWNGTTLKSIGPVVRGYDANIDIVLNSAVFLDLTGNGTLDAISTPADIGDNQYADGGVYHVYSLVNGKYVPSGELNAVYYYRRDKGAPLAKVHDFSVKAPSGTSVMTLVNGSGTSRLVSSAVIKLNGVTVVNQSQFNQQTKLIKVPVTLQASNTLSVTLNGAPGSLLTVAVGSQIEPQ